MMPTTKRHGDLYGNAPDKCPIALLLIDTINDFEFEGAEEIFPAAMEAARNIAQLEKHCRKMKIPVIYVNDNFGRWRSDFKTLLKHCLAKSVRGSKIAQLLRPRPDDYFVLKPKHSGFFGTTLHTLLHHLGVQAVILTGFTTDICVLFTANDAFIHGYKVIVPGDCVAASNLDSTTQALEIIRRVLKGAVQSSDELDLSVLRRGSKTPAHLVSSR